MNQLLLGYNQFLCGESVLRGEFNLSLFEDFNRLVEGCVLYDQLVLMGDYDLSGSTLYQQLHSAGVLDILGEAALRELTSRPDARVLVCDGLEHALGLTAEEASATDPVALLEARVSPNAQDRATYSRMADNVARAGAANAVDVGELRRWNRDNIFSTRHEGGCFTYFGRALVYAAVAETSGMDYSPDLLRLPIAALAFRRSYRSVPRALYEEVSRRFESEIEALALLGMPVAVYVPPMTAKILAKNPPIEDLLTEVLELRSAFDTFRATYREFSELLRSDSVSLKKKLEAKNKMFSSIVTAVEHSGTAHSLNVKTIWDKVVGANLDEKGLATKLSLSGMASLLLEQAMEARTTGRAQALFDLWTDSVNIENYCGLLESYFGTPIRPQEVKHLKAYATGVRAAMQIGQASN